MRFGAPMIQVSRLVFGLAAALLISWNSHLSAAEPENWSIPSSVANLAMKATVYRPAGKGPFKLAVINHGSNEDSRERQTMGMPQFPALTDWLLKRGYAVVIPERPGHGATGGPYIESQGSCGFPDYVKAGFGTALSIDATIDFMTRQPFVKRTGVLVVGNSAGGWGALALASQNPPQVAAIINFAGGRGGRNHNQPEHNCAADRLVAAAATFGKTARLPTLWLYAENDTYFAPALSRQLADAFVQSGGRAEYHLLPPVGVEGHALIQTAGKDASWAAVLAAFLHGLPTSR